MKKIFITYCLLVVALFVSAQKQANTWYFGSRVGLDFNQSPPKALSNFGLGSLEGCSVISDNNGKLLFYTNGLEVMNRKHTQMLNGDSLKGDASSTSNAVVVPLPSSNSIYYLFTIGSQNQSTKGLRYSVIDMKGDGGYGEVIQKNILVEDFTYEKLAAVKHCNKRDVWVTIHKANVDEYHSYLITSSGINPVPVISNTGFFPVNPIGAMKFSSDGSKLAAAYSFDTDTVEVMNFDNSTGALTSPITFRPEIVLIPDESFTKSYGVEFSPNGQLLYVSSSISSADPCKLFQFDLSSFNAAAILASKQVISQNSPWYAGALQIGPDQKIYMAMYKDSSLSVIENPDVYGPGCNFSYNKIYMAQSVNLPITFGLPCFIQSYFNPNSNPYDFERTGNCATLDVPFTINRITGINSVDWDFGDGQNSSSLSPVHHYNTPGYYTVTLTISKVADCSGTNEVVTHKIWVASISNFLGNDTGSCAAPSIMIGIDDVENGSYTWSTGASTNKITVNNFGKYWLQVEQSGCSITDTINITEKPKPIANAGKDTTVCIYKPVVLSAANPTVNSYLWSTGETTSSIKVNMAGVYTVDVTGNSCVVSDTVVVSWGDCDIFIPNAFVPSGTNNLFGPAGGFASYGYYMQVFDRWGNTIFTSGNPSSKWDGTYKGKAQPSGAYTWILSYVDRLGQKQFMQGSVMLIR